MKTVRRRSVDEHFLDGLLGLESSKIGFYAEVKQKIRELEQTNLDLRTKRRELQAVFDAIHDAVMIYDGRRELESTNRVGRNLFLQGSIPGTPCAAVFHPDPADTGADCPVEAALRGDASQVEFSRSSGDRERFFEATASPIQDAEGRPTRALVLIRDVTQRKNQESKLHQTAKLSSVGMLAAGVAHEINNPLTSVAGYAEALLRRLDEHPGLAAEPGMEDFPKYLQVIVREAYRCKAVIESLLSFSRRPQAVSGPVDLRGLVDEVLQLLRHRARAESVVITTDLPDDLPAVVGDPNGLRQVVMNLTMNALQAIDGPGRVRIAAAARAGELRLCVTDTGPGIPPDKLNQIWDPFFTTKGVGEGLGLGLSVTYNIVRKHGGRIEARNLEDGGTRFTVSLPAEGSAR